MKKRFVFALIMTMALCSCGEEEVHQKPNRPSSAVTTTAASAEATTAASQEEAAATTSAAADTAAETTTTAAEAATETAVTEAVSAANDAAADAAGSHASLVTDDPFAGLYVDENNGLFSMTIDNVNGTDYNVKISRKTAENQSTQWYITGAFDGRAVLHYNNCSKSILTYSVDGSVASETVYTGGTGYISISERGDATGMVWSDDVDNAGSGAFFIK
ncbi:MAG: hypothetical protein K5898_12635 [Ruminococcus sp.]|uniref:hypothetical protein n=1 Tax=Ruminococcus sp. TaxID=41978 RepID=UPI0025D2B1D0|nr:hypothetical protein [Ruminococcus sp.]MCR4795988.1 hypothetical protein [Ruminococcus sp.]